MYLAPAEKILQQWETNHHFFTTAPLFAFIILLSQFLGRTQITWVKIS